MPNSEARRAANASLGVEARAVWFTACDAPFGQSGIGTYFPAGPSSPFPGGAGGGTSGRLGHGGGIGEEETDGLGPKGRMRRRGWTMLHGVIMAGGRGEGVWPQGGPDGPREVLPLFGEIR